MIGSLLDVNAGLLLLVETARRGGRRARSSSGTRRS
jgi:hypothetical protein